MLNVTFHGVRGSTPTPGPATVRYGGHTACVALEVPSRDPIVLDLGTGLRSWAATLDHTRPLRATALLTHLHLDHLQGLPFFEPLERPGAALDVYGPAPAEGPLAKVLGDLFGPPWVPEPLTGVRFYDCADEELSIGDAKVWVRTVPHRGPANGYRVEWEGASVAYVSDHQAPPGLDTVPEQVLELADGVDLLVHDAQYTAAEWGRRGRWGHSTVDYAVLVARQAGARRLALFHHDPARSDDDIDRLLDGARRAAERLGVDEVLAAAEGVTVSFERP
jgi:phosphoribosyl 1,2-cyclic phosphodiesterase